jgi:hypothetical protein
VVKTATQAAADTMRSWTAVAAWARLVIGLDLAGFGAY